MLKRPRSEVGLSAPELTQHLGRAGTAEAILLLVSSHGDKFNDIHVATALHCLARSKPLPPASSLTALCGIAQRALEQKCKGASVGGGSCKARTISALCFSIATLDLLGCEPLSLALSQAVGASLPSSDGASVSSILWCMGKGWKPSEGHLPRGTLALKASALARTMSPTEVANAAWGAARSGIIHGPMWASFSQRVLAILIPSPSTSSSSFRPAAFTPHGLAIVAWSWGYARLQDSPLGEALGRAIMPLLQSRTAFEALELSQLAFAWVRGVFPARIATPLWEVFVGAVATALPTLTPSTSTSLLAAVMAASMAASSGGSGSGSGGSGGDGDGTSSSSTPSSPHLLPLAQSLTMLSLSADFSTLGPSELSCICLAIGRGLHRGGSSSTSTSQPTSHQLISRLCPPLCESASVMPWRSVGACDVALRVLLLEEGAGEEERGGGGKQKKKKKGGGSESASDVDVAATFAAALNALGERAVAITKELEEASDALCAAPGALFISLLHSQHPQLQLLPSSAGGGNSSSVSTTSGGGGGTSTVLLYGDDPQGAVTRALVAEGGREKGCGVVQVVHWRRMECEGGVGESKVGGEMNVEKEEEEDGEGGEGSSSKKRRNKAQPWIDDSLFSTTSSSTTSSSSSTPSPLCSAAVIRFPSSLDAFSYALAAILPHLSVGAPIYVLGGAGEGLTPAFLSGVEAAAATAAAPTTTRTTGGGGSSGRPALKNVTVLASSAASSAASGSIVCRAFKADGKVGASHAFDFEEWVTTPPSPSSSAEVAAGEVATSGYGKKCQHQQQQGGGGVMVAVSSLLPSPWISLPGLFAGGGLDVMSAHLIDLSRRKGWVSSGSGGGSGSGSGAMRVLDFCCGNGAIGGALKGINPSLHLTLCDADALAMQACMRNLEGVRQHLSGGGGCGGSGGGIKFRQRAGLPPIHGSKKRLFHAIFSNPPVHRGQGDSLGVVCELLAGAGERLVRPGGALHIVAQAHIPVGALAVGLGVAGGGGGQVVKVEHHSVEGGRFIVWRLVY